MPSTQDGGDVNKDFKEAIGAGGIAIDKDSPWHRVAQGDGKGKIEAWVAHIAKTRQDLVRMGALHISMTQGSRKRRQGGFEAPGQHCNSASCWLSR